MRLEQFRQTLELMKSFHNYQMEQEVVARGINLKTLYANSNSNSDKDTTDQEPDTDNEYEAMCHHCVQIGKPDQSATEDYKSEDNELKEDETQGNNFVDMMMNVEDTDEESDNYVVSTIGYDHPASTPDQVK